MLVFVTSNEARVDSHKKDRGTVPEMPVEDTSKLANTSRFPSSEGREPVKRFIEMSRDARLSIRPKCEGMVPLKLLFPIEISERSTS
jgi:hypothetical protein